MDQLSIYLPPFSGDYAGVCSALYDLNCVVIIDDASCCTRNYVSYDEPRWTVKRKTTFCSRLRTMDAILGDDEKLILEAIAAARKYEPEFIAVLGTPVPAVIGKDMNGIAREIEARSGYPALGFDTTGFSYYNKGISAAFLKLLKRFAEPAAKAAKGVNILGLTPLDFSANDNGAQLRGLLENNGFELVCGFLMDAELSMVRRAAGAGVNLVVSQSGWAAAEYMSERYGIPYVAAVPLGREFSGIVMEAVKQTAEDKHSRVINGAAFTDRAAPSMLIVGDQVIANSLRAAIYQKGFKSGITVASFFALEPELSIQGDIFLNNEKQLLDLLRSGRYAAMIADPLITGLPAAAGLKCHSLPHPAVSSSLYWDQVPLYTTDAFENTLQSWIDTE